MTDTLYKQALVGASKGLDGAALGHEDVEQTNEIAEIFTGTLKPYQVASPPLIHSNGGLHEIVFKESVRELVTFRKEFGAQSACGVWGLKKTLTIL